jgi:hypothetical protein
MAKGKMGSQVIAALMILGASALAWAQEIAPVAVKTAAPKSSATSVSRLDLVSFLAKVAPALPSETWQVEQLPWEPNMIRALGTFYADQDRAEKVLKLWEEGRCIVLTWRKDPARIVGVSVARFKNEAGARSFLSLAVDWQRKRDTAAGSACSHLPRILESRLTELSHPGADQEFLSLKRLKYESTGTSSGKETPIIVETTVLARVGAYVSECSWHGVSGDPVWLKEFMTSLEDALQGRPALFPSLAPKTAPSPPNR